MSTLAFDNPWAWLLGLPLVAAAVWGLARRQWRSGRPRKQIAALALLRGGALCVLVALIARPVWMQSDDEIRRRNQVAVLIDRSESMSLASGGPTRLHEAVVFARGLLPQLKTIGARGQLFLFAEDAAMAEGRQVAAAVPDGKRTNLARAIVRAVSQADPPPLAVIALTDGQPTEEADNARAITALTSARVPLLGVGFGREAGTQVLSLDRVTAPPVAARNQQFRIAAQLRATGGAELPAFDLVLLRDGQFAQKKTIPRGPGMRTWQESFLIREPQEHLYRYTIELLPPPAAGVKCPASVGTAAVRIAGEKEFRVLFVQGALTWDYKFIRVALAGDPVVKLSALSRTANQSTLFQSSDEDRLLAGGFPCTMEDLAAFRVVILANLRPGDLTAAQQELLARFCREFAGGVLMIGGPDTFNAFWRGSTLEQLLPVRFAAAPRRTSGLQEVRLQVTAAALAHPVFHVSDVDDRRAWAALPPFSQYAAVDAVKPGAQVWAVLASSGADAGAALMASQRYGAGLSGVICVQNFWRWRLAKESEPRAFDRFWQQLLRYLGEGGRGPIDITLPDQRLQPGSRIRVILQRRPEAGPAAGEATYRLQVQDEGGRTIVEQAVALRPGGSAEAIFTVERGGLYPLSVLDSAGTIVASRSLEIRDVDYEFAATGRNMETLRQWAGVSGGIALRAEDCSDAGRLVEEIKAHMERASQGAVHRTPAGVSAWVFAALLACLCGEWLLRKRWVMV